LLAYVKGEGKNLWIKLLPEKSGHMGLLNRPWPKRGGEDASRVNDDDCIRESKKAMDETR